MLFQDIVFWALAALALGAAVAVVTLRDLLRAALCLVVVFVAVAGFFVMAQAEFLAAVQVLIYAGAISILIIFGVMMTRNVSQGNLSNRLQIPAVALAALLLTALAAAAVATDWRRLDEVVPAAQQAELELTRTQTIGVASPERLAEAGLAPGEQPRNLGDLLVSDYALHFELAAVLLVAALLGALALLRGRGQP